MGKMKKRRERDVQIYREYMKLLADPGNERYEVAEKLRKKYDYGSLASIYAIRKRVEDRISNGEVVL